MKEFEDLYTVKMYKNMLSQEQMIEILTYVFGIIINKLAKSIINIINNNINIISH